MAGDVHGELLIDGAPARPADAQVARSERTMLLVGLSAAAGIIHARALFDHATHYWLFGVFFGVLTYAQVLWAIIVYRRPDERRWLMPAAVGSLVVLGIWIVSRSVGLPIGPWAGRPEPFGVADIAASLDELVLAALIVAIVRPAGRVAARMRWLNGANCIRIGSMLVALSLLATLLGNHTHPGAG
ncbi:MAG: hypothetical protein QOG42_473 [Solirubrobacteraceae bacterium]|nr:hypothetical protein [Solirubrobacteraceae bacterium]